MIIDNSCKILSNKSCEIYVIKKKIKIFFFYFDIFYIKFLLINIIYKNTQYFFAMLTVYGHKRDTIFKHNINIYYYFHNIYYLFLF